MEGTDVTVTIEYSRAGRMLGERSRVDVAALVDETVALVAPPPGFLVRRMITAPPVETYRTPLRQVLQNLVGNAIKHHDGEAGTVMVICEKRGPALHFIVCDDGPGIPREFHERVFEMFETLNSRDEEEGSGMGLAIVKKIVESHGGRIAIDASGGHGTRIIFDWHCGEVLEPPQSESERVGSAA